MVAAVLQTAFVARSQELEPRAYSISSQGTNFLILGFTILTGDVSFDPDLPIEDASSTLHRLRGAGELALLQTKTIFLPAGASNAPIATTTATIGTHE
jgi:hypothetical protein